MRNDVHKLPALNIAFAMTLGALLSACGGSSVMKEPIALELNHPLGIAADDKMVATLDWVVVRDGPGTWARNALWDEYRLRVENRGNQTITVRQVQVVDSVEKTIVPIADRELLVDFSKETEKRYAEYDLDVRPGANTSAMIATGVTGTVVVSLATGYALASGTAGVVSAGSLAGAGAVIVYSAPLFIIGGIVHVENNKNVNEEIVRRHSAFPVQVAPGEIQEIVAFFPIAPSPSTVQLIYETADGAEIVDIDSAANL